MVGLILTYVSPLCCFGMFSIFHLVSYNIRTSYNFSSSGLAWPSLEVVLDTISEIHDEAAAAFSALNPESGRTTRTDHTRAAPARNLDRPRRNLYQLLYRPRAMPCGRTSVTTTKHAAAAGGSTTPTGGRDRVVAS
jgi:hypothetical protein